MDLEFWKKKWISGHTGFHQLSVEPLLENHFLRILKSFEKRFLSNLGGECRIFVPLCGKSVDMLWLKNLEETHPSSLAQNTGVKVTVLGCEISPVASRAFFTENNLRYEEHSSGPFTVFIGDGISVYCGDFFSMEKEILGPIHLIYDRAAMVALPREQRLKYWQHLQALCPLMMGYFLIAPEWDSKIHLDGSSGPPFSISQGDLEMESGPSFHWEKLGHQEKTIGGTQVTENLWWSFNSGNSG